MCEAQSNFSWWRSGTPARISSLDSAQHSWIALGYDGVVITAQVSCRCLAVWSKMTGGGLEHPIETSTREVSIQVVSTRRLVIKIWFCRIGEGCSPAAVNMFKIKVAVRSGTWSLLQIYASGTKCLVTSLLMYCRLLRDKTPKYSDARSRTHFNYKKRKQKAYWHTSSADKSNTY